VKRDHQIALWTGVTAFFTNVIGLELLDRISDHDVWQIAEGVIVSVFVAGAVYAKQRLADAKGTEGDGDGNSPPPA
jgi:hypothetical protein